MPIEERIVAWSRQRPQWQQVVLGSVAGGEPLSNDGLEQLVDAVVDERALPAKGLEIEHLLGASAAGSAVRLESISEPRHVNALSSAAALTFPEGGLAIVYGDNGSGKSGYARLLKRIARSRHHEDVLTDVFRDTAVDQATAKLAVRIGDQLHDVDWPTASRPEVQRMLFYDSSCGSAYIAEEADFPYRPYALFAMDGLITACGQVRELADRKLLQNARKARELPRVTYETSDTAAARFLAGLSAESSVEELDALVAKLEDAEMSMATVESQEATLRSGDTRQARADLERAAERLDWLCDHIARVDSVVGQEATREMARIGEELERVEEAAEEHAKSLASEPLPGVGNAAWKVLWESAKRFSESHAYADQPFPVTGAESRCVLCLRPLGESGGRTLSSLDRFVRDDVQLRRDEVQTKHASLLEARRSQQVLGGAVDTTLRDLETSHPDEARIARGLLAGYEAVREREAGTQGAAPDAEGVIARLRGAAKESRSLAKDLERPELIRHRLHAVVDRRREIELLTAMKAARKEIVEEIGRLGVRRRLENLKQEANTGPITRKILELSEETITEMVRDRFTRETDRLGLERVTIAKTQARKGALLHQPKLVGARQASELSDVFSEGERSALGLAAFFTEASLDDSRSALVLDDPVTSLDHIRRERVAERLVDFAETRQVVVFTHDVAFVGYLKSAASRKDVPVAERSVSRSRAGERLPGLCVDRHPWTAKDVRRRLGELRTELAKMAKRSDEYDDQEYEDAVAGWAGKMSETWERIFSQEIVGQVLADGGLEVRPKMVRVLARFTEEDYLSFDDSYGRVSRWARRHDKSAYLNYVPPQLSELEKELGLVDDWFKRVGSYSK